MASPRRSRAGIWLLPFSLLTAFSAGIFILTFYVDAHGDFGPLNLLWHPNVGSAANTIGNAGEVVAAVLGIAITVVAIIVELASNRYTHRITELFVQEPINFGVMGFFVVSALQAILVAMTFDQDGSGFVPYFGIFVSMGMLAVCLLLLLPYFAFVFHFLNPIQIVDRIRQHALDVIVSRRPMPIDLRQAEAVRGIEQLADVGLNAMEHKDKGVSMASVDALKNMVLQYQELRRRLPDEWFEVKGDLAHNPDFVSMSDDVLRAVTDRRIWFEMKILRKFQTLYNEALNRMRDIDYLIAINTRQIAEAALEMEKQELEAAAARGERIKAQETEGARLFDLVVKFFNTYLRATINARDVRTAYNILHQYRLLAEGALMSGEGGRAVELARYFKYYGTVSFNAKLPFILETVAYDLCALNELAFDLKSPAHQELLRILLEVDKESEGDVQETSLRGVRKAQVKLATYYLVNDAERYAKQVYRDMERERRERLASIRDELLGVRSAEFWEISDRGVNFDYLEKARKDQLLVFFSWFDDLDPPRPSRLPSVPPGVELAAPALPHRPRASGETSLHDVPGAGPDPGAEASEPAPSVASSPPEASSPGPGDTEGPASTESAPDSRHAKV